MPDHSLSIHQHLNRMSHLEINVADLERSRTWYEVTTPLRVVAETSADQAFPSFGFERARFEGYMLQDTNQIAPFPMLHLVEWKTPGVVGTAGDSHARVVW